MIIVIMVNFRFDVRLCVCAAHVHYYPATGTISHICIFFLSFQHTLESVLYVLWSQSQSINSTTINITITTSQSASQPAKATTVTASQLHILSYQIDECDSYGRLNVSRKRTHTYPNLALQLQSIKCVYTVLTRRSKLVDDSAVENGLHQWHNNNIDDDDDGE